MADVGIQRLNIILSGVNVAPEQRERHIRTRRQLQHGGDRGRYHRQPLHIAQQRRKHIAGLARADKDRLPCVYLRGSLLGNQLLFLVDFVQNLGTVHIAAELRLLLRQTQTAVGAFCKPLLLQFLKIAPHRGDRCPRDLADLRHGHRTPLLQQLLNSLLPFPTLHL